jgi:hypothetical protein
MHSGPIRTQPTSPSIDLVAIADCLDGANGWESDLRPHN